MNLPNKVHKRIIGIFLSFSYNEFNLPKQIINSYDGDNEIWDYTYDANGNRIKTEASADGNKASLETEYQLVYIPFELTGEDEERFEEFPEEFLGM